MELFVITRVNNNGENIYRYSFNIEIDENNLDNSKLNAYTKLDNELREIKLLYMDYLFAININIINISNLHINDLFEIMQNFTQISYFYTINVSTKIPLPFDLNTGHIYNVINYNNYNNYNRIKDYLCNKRYAILDVIININQVFLYNINSVLSLINGNVDTILKSFEQNITKILIKYSPILTFVKYYVIQNVINTNRDFTLNGNVFEQIKINGQNNICTGTVNLGSHDFMDIITYNYRKKIELNSDLKYYLKQMTLENNIDFTVYFNHNNEYIDLYCIYQYCKKNKVSITIMKNTHIITNPDNDQKIVIINKIFKPYISQKSLDSVVVKFSKNTNILSKCDYLFKHNKYKKIKNNIIKYIYLLYINGLSIELLLIVLHYYFGCLMEN